MEIDAEYRRLFGLSELEKEMLDCLREANKFIVSQYNHDTNDETTLLPSDKITKELINKIEASIHKAESKCNIYLK